MSTAVTMKLMYGYDTSLSHDHLVVFAEEVVTIPGYSLPFVAAINIFPTLRYLPSCFPEAGFKKIGKKPKRATVKMKETLMQYVKKKMVRLYWPVLQVYVYNIRLRELPFPPWFLYSLVMENMMKWSR